MSFQFGAAIGLAVVSAVYVAAAGGDGSPQASLDGYRAALIVPFAGAALGAAVSSVGLRRAHRPVPSACAPATDCAAA